jgi:hypothetical protein
MSRTVVKGFVVLLAPYSKTIRLNTIAVYFMNSSSTVIELLIK